MHSIHNIEDMFGREEIESDYIIVTQHKLNGTLVGGEIFSICTMIDR